MEDEIDKASLCVAWLESTVHSAFVREAIFVLSFAIGIDYWKTEKMERYKTKKGEASSGVPWFIICFFFPRAYIQLKNIRTVGWRTSDSLAKPHNRRKINKSKGRYALCLWACDSILGIIKYSLPPPVKFLCLFTYSILFYIKLC